MMPSTSSVGCAIYCRYSSEQQRDSMSIEAQRRACLEFAEKYGWRVAKVYVDEARSGTSDDRAAFQEMIRDAIDRSHPFELILVHKLDRFARNRYDSIKYKHILRKRGVRVASVSEPAVGSGDPTDVLLESMLEGVAEYYSLNLARESLKGMSENARHGWWNGGFAPFGYRLIQIQTEKGGKRKLAVEESEAQVVRQIFARYLKGEGVNAIRYRLNTEGIKYRSGYKFTRNTILRILRNEKYVGDAAFGKQLNKRQRPIDTKLEKILVRDSHEPIVDRQTWDRVQTTLEGRRMASRAPRAVASPFLFSGIMECAFCSARFVGKSCHGHGGFYRYYVCNTVERAGPGSCAQYKFNADDLERVFMRRLKDRLTSHEPLIAMIRAHNEALKQAQARRSQLVPKIEQEIQTIERKRTRLYEALEDGMNLNKEDIAPRLRQLTAMRSAKELERDQLKAQLAARPVKASEDAIREWVEFYEALFADETFWARKTLVQRLMVSVKIDDQFAHLSYNPALTSEQDRVPLGRNEGGGPNGKSLEPPPNPPPEEGSHKTIKAPRPGFEPGTC